ncbi:MAG: hypothetical protein ACTSQW_00070 [Promethearchaeota archaeon]
MKKKFFALFIIVISLPALFLILNGTANPTYGTDHAGCHDNTLGYSISTDMNATNSVNPSDVIVFNITATGPNLFVQARNQTTLDGFMHNGNLTILPTTDRILDNAPGLDKDSNPNAMIVTFNITIPDTEEIFYYLFILAGDDSSGQPEFASIRIGFSVGGAAPPEPEFEIFDHFGLLIGLSALILLSVGTILVLINENKFVKIHGIFSGASWILTLINAISLINLNKNDLPFEELIQLWFSFEPFPVHIIHIILGAVGLFTGLLSMLFGIAAERKYARLTGYITLICWWTGFFLGLVLVPLF